MYDDLARTQNLPPLERFVVHALIPTVLVTAALHWSPAVPAAPQEPTYAFICSGIEHLSRVSGEGYFAVIASSGLMSPRFF